MEDTTSIAAAESTTEAEAEEADNTDSHTRQIPSINNEDHPLNRLVFPPSHHHHHHNHNEGHHNNNSTAANHSSDSTIFHMRRHSDSTAFLDLEHDHHANNNNETASAGKNNVLRSSSRDETITTTNTTNKTRNASTPTTTATTTAVTFADTPTAGRSHFDGRLARRRHSASGGTPTQQTQAQAQAHAPAPPPPAPLPPLPARGRVYRSSIATDKLTTRDIAALDFLLGIPLEAEETIVHHGWMLQQRRKMQSKQAGVDDGSDDDDDDDDDDDGYRGNGSSSTKRGDDDEVLLEPPTSSLLVNSVPGAVASNSHRGRWWEKWIPGDAVRKSQQGGSARGGKGGRNGSNHHHDDDVELELPTALGTSTDSNSGDMTSSVSSTYNTATPLTSTPSGNSSHHNNRTSKTAPHEAVAVRAPVYAPGRRLEGDEAFPVQIPLKVDTVTRQKSIARQAAIREWELKVAHGLRGGSSSHNKQPQQPPLLDGRLFFSAAGSYPMAVFSLKRYEPKREEAALRRQKLEARGGGGSHFVMPSRDWRGISYRALLPRKAEQARNQKAFNRFLRHSKIHKQLSPSKKRAQSKQQQQQHDHSSSDDGGNDADNDAASHSDDDDESSLSSSSSEDSYIPGILDDPEMTLGRHRNVMIGDCVTGCIVASTIQFVKPALLKADLNQKFRERFDGWEPSKSQRKYIGARVVDGVYTLIDPTTTEDATPGGKDENHESEDSNTQPAIIRMPPSLTLSKIRSVKRQALLAFVKANLEVGTVALACVYFERLCLSCRVDKTNRRLCFASCLLLASKINEPNEVLVMKEDNAASGNESGTDDGSAANPRRKMKLLQSSIRPNKRSSSMFASLLEFFTSDWSLSLKHLFAAEWGVFAALRFSLHATPSQVAFHFRRLMKTLEWNPLHYLGTEMYNQWGNALATEEKRRMERKRRREVRRLRKERRIQRELEKEVMRSKQTVENELLRKRNTKGGSSGSKPPTISQQKQQASVSPNPVNSSPGLDDKYRLPPRASSARASLRQQDQSNNDSSQSDMDNLLGRRTGNNARQSSTSPQRERQSQSKKPRPIKLLHRLGMQRRPASDVKLNELASEDQQQIGGGSEQESPTKRRATFGILPLSPSMPLIASQPQDASQSQHEQQQQQHEKQQQQDHIVIDIPNDLEHDNGNDDKHDPNGDDEEMGENSSVNNRNAGLAI